MVGYPYHYGDSGCSDQVTWNITKKIARISCFALVLGMPVCAANAVDVAVPIAKDARVISKSSLALTALVCSAAGSVCTKSITSAANGNPKMMLALTCVATMSWCAAKASPL